jgi:Flp pilus assembly protein TadD
MLIVALGLGGCATAYLAQARNAMSLGNYEEARSYAAEALRLEPQNPRARRLLGDILVHSGTEALTQDDLANARYYFTEAARVDPENPDATHSLELVREAEARQAPPAVGKPSSGEKPKPARTEPAKAEKPPSPPEPKPAGEKPHAPVPAEASAHGRALKRAAPIYEGPSPLAAEVGRLSAGARVSVIREVGAWDEVEFGDGKRGYVAADAIE